VRQLADSGEPSVGRDGQPGADLAPAAVALVCDSSNTSLVLDESSHVRAHHNPEVRVLPRFVGEEFEEARLRHDRHVGKGRRQSVEREPGHGPRRGDCPERRRLHVWQLEQPLCQPDLVEHLERRRVDRIAAKIAIEVSVCLEQRHANARACQQE
jgi:hypothetical protein